MRLIQRQRGLIYAAMLVANDANSCRSNFQRSCSLYSVLLFASCYLTFNCMPQLRQVSLQIAQRA